MIINKFVWLIAFVVFVGFPIEKDVLAEESNSSIELSYRFLEGYNDDQTLNMLVKLRAKNISGAPISNLVASVSFVENIRVDIDTIYLGDINNGDTRLSTESFNISYEGSSTQDRPQTKVIWKVEFDDVHGNQIVEEKVLFE